MECQWTRNVPRILLLECGSGTELDANLNAGQKTTYRRRLFATYRWRQFTDRLLSAIRRLHV